MRSVRCVSRALARSRCPPNACPPLRYDFAQEAIKDRAEWEKQIHEHYASVINDAERRWQSEFDAVGGPSAAALLGFISFLSRVVRSLLTHAVSRLRSWCSARRRRCARRARR